MDEEVLEARKRLAARFGQSQTQIGGKGKQFHSVNARCLGTQRRKKKAVTKATVNEDKKVMSAIKKFGM